MNAGTLLPTVVNNRKHLRLSIGREEGEKTKQKGPLTINLPPSTVSIAPSKYPPALLESKSTGPTISSGKPGRPTPSKQQRKKKKKVSYWLLVHDMKEEPGQGHGTCKGGVLEWTRIGGGGDRA